MRKNCTTCKHDRLKTPICDECYHTSDAPTKWEPATYYEPDTNADRIRAMSDEELAKILDAFTAYFDECNRSVDEIDCHNCELCSLCSLGEGKAIKWLKQPVEVDGNG